MTVTFLGTGTSHGIPVIGCSCRVCTSENPRNMRTRCAVFVDCGPTKLLIDTPPELRLQLVRERISCADAVLFTHAHADHIFGLDDVRRFNHFLRSALPCYGSEQTLRTIRRAFDYVFVPTQVGGGKPLLDLICVDSAFQVQEVSVTPIPVLHGELPVLGYRIGGFAYVTDCSRIPRQSLDLLRGLDTLVLGVLRPEANETHFSLSEGLAVVGELKPKRAWFTHVSHRLEHEQANASWPPDVQLAYDGLTVEIAQ